MPRKQRCRCISGYPNNWQFTPEDREISAEPVILTLDEYETIRLIDEQDLTQEQCALEMGVSRTTVTAIYSSARKKIASMLVHGRPLQISGGIYRIKGLSGQTITKKRSDIMRVAVTYDNGQIFQHFGHTEQFKLYDIENGSIISEEILDASGSGHGALAVLLKEADVDALICGGIGGGAQAALFEAGIRLFGGVQGDADEAVKALAEGRLSFDPDVMCSHHDHHGSCGEHSCGSHSCHH